MGTLTFKARVLMVGRSPGREEAGKKNFGFSDFRQRAFDFQTRPPIFIAHAIIVQTIILETTVFVDRQKELAFLNSMLTRKHPGPAQLILMYGRR